MTKTVSMSLAMLLVAALAGAQDVAEVQRNFEAGRFQEVVSATAPESPPEVIYTAAQSYQKLGAADQAIQTYAQLVARPEGDPWHFIGLAGTQLVQDQNEAAVASAQQAVAIAPTLASAHYQLGLALARLQQWPEAAAAFDAATAQEPTLAYAYYYGGMMYYRAKRVDLMSLRFQRFLILAPEAPERPEVQSIMRTLRGR